MSGNAGSEAQTDGDITHADKAEQRNAKDQALADGGAESKPGVNKPVSEAAQSESKRDEQLEEYDEDEDEDDFGEDEGDAESDADDRNADSEELDGSKKVTRDSGQSGGAEASNLAALAAKRMSGRGVKPKPKLKTKAKPSATQQAAPPNASAMPRSEELLASPPSANQMQTHDETLPDQAEQKSLANKGAPSQALESKPPTNPPNSSAPDSAFWSSSEASLPTETDIQAQKSSAPDSAFSSSTEPLSDFETSSDSANEPTDVNASDSSDEEAPPTVQSATQPLDEDAAESIPTDLSTPEPRPNEV